MTCIIKGCEQPAVYPESTIPYCRAHLDELKSRVDAQYAGEPGFRVDQAAHQGVVPTADGEARKVRRTRGSV